ncbi:MAG: hypothetical protein HGB23_08900 [Chlorobiaceae bacterium]|nr:hypothetical protein [Chlorobiaceae bacterium]
MLFPLRFDPSALQGPRAIQHPNRPDAFQQLVGDVLREEFGFRVSVSPTKGKDGAIDAFIDDRNDDSALANLPAPQIIECKDHDDSCKDFLDNINQGWYSVADKLQKQAALGWTGDFEPWRRVKSYVYCISSNIGKQANREKLQQKLTNFFFKELKESLRPPLLEEIRILDWSDLQDNFNRFPRIADKWIGLQLPKIKTHAEYCDSLTQFRRYLLEENFPFVAPETENLNAGPTNILIRLEQLVGKGGVLLKGIGGVGKTRTALEVAQLSDDKGWRVLHLLPGEPGLTVDDLSEVLFSGNEKTLLVLDYLDQMPKLDLGSIRRRILPEAAKRVMPLALLANLRPSSLRNPNTEREALFTEHILLQTSARQKARITEIALERIAPLAIAQLGHEKVHKLCGERPIIAMFIAEELQRRALNDTLGNTELIGMRNDDLSCWLHKRLIEDKLVVSDNGDGFLPAQPDPLLIAAAAMLATTPLTRDHMEEAGEKAFFATGGKDAQTVSRVLNQLLSLGWIEQRGIEFSAAHDVVADEVFNEVLWDRSSDQFREAVLDCCLTPALGRARTLGRYATALTRLQGSEKTETRNEAALNEKAGHWLSKHCAELGQMLATTEASESAYALGSIISTPGWATVCITDWSQLVAPWLNNHRLHPEARHLLYRGLKELPEGTAQELINTALDWLPHHLNSDTASYVLNPLLNRKETNEQNTERAIAFAMQWLDIYPLLPVTRYVLSALLARDDLGEHSIRTIDFTMLWLKKFHLDPDARFVLSALLARNDLGKDSSQAIKNAINWIEMFPLAPDANLVIARLLERKDLYSFSNRAIEFAINWFEKFSLMPETEFVLSALLAHNDLGKHSSRAIEFAINWLEKLPLVLDTQFVLHTLLASKDLGNFSNCAIEFAMHWLKKFPLVPEAGFVLPPLLARNDLGEHSSRAIGYAINWFEMFPLAPDVDFVIARLLERKDLGGFSNCIIEFAINWLQKLPLVPDTRYVLAPLLARVDLGERSSIAIEFAMHWLKKFPLVPEAGFVLAPLLVRNDLGARSSIAIEYAINWIEIFSLAPDTDFVIARLLERKDLDGFSIRAIEFAINWIEMFPLAHDADYVIARLLERKDLDGFSIRAIELTLSWLKVFLLHNQASFVFNPLLKRNELGNQSIQAINFAIQWLNHFSLDTKASFVLTPLLYRNDLGNYADQTITLAVKWVKNFLKTPKAQFVCKALLSRNDLEPSDRIQLQELLNKFYKSDKTYIDPEIAHELTDAALGKREKLNIQRLEEIVEILENAINTSRPVPAAFMLPGLLAIVQPLEEPELWKRIIELANQILKHPKFLSKNKAGLAKNVWYLVDMNAWPEKLAKPVLDELGLDRPSASNQPERSAT